MSDPVGPGQPPAASRFRKGQSGNPKGRPRARRKPAASAFDIVIDRTFTITRDGQTRELTVEEALQHKTYEAALTGNRAARREVLKMIAKREKWLAMKSPVDTSIEVLVEPADPTNANEALLLLGIAEQEECCDDPNDPDERLLLQPWAVQAALRRRRRGPLSKREIAEINRCTRDPHSISWPASAGE